ncbi:MAG: hypothetical protein E6G85_11730 [Alphaproteobacteria bacterium]|nr:MAG: hypothetical protein E6G85_11730 [Alphaproteobacteria bacterium]
MAGIATRLRGFIARRPDQELFPHFSEAGTAIFVVQQVEYGGHDRTPSFDHRSARVITLLAAKG